MRKWSLHACPLDKECRMYGAPARVSVRTPWLYVSFALTPGGRFVHRDADGHDHFRWITTRSWRCP